jgi:alpha-amylase
MEKVALLFCVHNHQPVGNFRHILEDAYQRAYFPFIEVLQRYPFMKITLHYSGVLWDFFREVHPEFVAVLRDLVGKGQIEMMTGGYYEPILPVVPDEDKTEQILSLTRTLQEEMGVAPKGMWLAERVWEPHLPKFLVDAGVEYVTIDDYHFKKVGLRDEDLNGYYLTEEEGKVLKLFPGSERLRYLIPFHQPKETLEYLSRLRGSSKAGIFADDGEKFGIWPYTFHSVYEEGWLEEFFRMIGDHLSWIEPMSFGSYANRHKPSGRIYISCSAYMEMDEWSLPTEAMAEYGRVVEKLSGSPEGDSIRRFLKGGFWRNFFAKYPESNDLHKRILHLRRKVGRSAGEILLHLHRAQCNDAYWHGVFGGLYLPHLRHGLYENLIQAEALYDAERHGEEKWVDAERVDFNGDGDEEVILKNPEAVFVFSSRGGSLLEMDYRPKAFNILNTLTRRKEGYHQKLESQREAKAEKVRTIHEIFDAKEGALEQYLHFDRYRRASFLDHFIAGPIDVESVRRSLHEEVGDFIGEPYDIRIEEGVNGIHFSRSGGIRNGRISPVRVEKEFLTSLDKSMLKASYHIASEDLKKWETSFGIEFNINLLAGNAPDRFYEIPGCELEDRRLASMGRCSNVSEVLMIDEWNGIKVGLKTDRGGSLLRFPVETVSLSESGFERVYQGSCLILYWPLELEPGLPFEVNIELGVESL